MFYQKVRINESIQAVQKRGCKVFLRMFYFCFLRTTSVYNKEWRISICLFNKRRTKAILSRSAIKRPTDSTTSTTSGETTNTSGKTSTRSGETSITSTTSGRASTMRDQTNFASTASDKTDSAIIITLN